MGFMVNTADSHGTPLGMGNIGDRAHGQWGTWATEHMDITPLILHGSLPNFN